MIYTELVEKYNVLLNAGRDKAVLGMTFGMMLFYGVPFAIIAFFGILYGTDVIRSLVESVLPTVMRGMTAVDGGVMGYRLGSKYIAQAIESRLLGCITKAATIMGLMMVNVMSAVMVKFATTYKTTIAILYYKTCWISVGLIPLQLVLGCFYLLRSADRGGLVQLPVDRQHQIYSGAVAAHQR